MRDPCTHMNLFNMPDRFVSHNHVSYVAWLDASLLFRTLAATVHLTSLALSNVGTTPTACEGLKEYAKHQSPEAPV